MTHEETVRHVARLTGTDDKVYFLRTKGLNHRDQWGWRPTLADAQEILKRCEPFMVTKKRNAQILIELVDIRKTSTRSVRNWERQFELASENRLLNRRGVV